MIKSGLIPREY